MSHFCLGIPSCSPERQKFPNNNQINLVRHRVLNFEMSGGLITGLFRKNQKRALSSFFSRFFPSRSLIVLLLPTKILHEAELPSLLKKKREKKGELDPLLAPEFVQIPELDLQLTHIWPQNPDLAVLLAQRSTQRLHRSKLPHRFDILSSF